MNKKIMILTINCNIKWLSMCLSLETLPILTHHMTHVIERKVRLDQKHNLLKDFSYSQ